jgi:hypothetical protein
MRPDAVPVPVIDIADELDQLATEVFGDAAGGDRLSPILARWNEDVGELRPEDPQTGLMIATRLDWALVDAPARVDAHGRSWCALAASGQLEGVDPTAAARCLRTHVGLFEVWPAYRCSWLRDRVAGICVRLVESLALPPAARGPAALWEVRVLVENGVARLCRPPLDYPIALVELLPDPATPGRDRTDFWAQLRRGRVRHARTPKLDLRLAFRDALC